MGRDKSEFAGMNSANLCLYLTESTSLFYQLFLYVEINWCEKQSSLYFFSNADIQMSMQSGV